jgi:hypothetical protein
VSDFCRLARSLKLPPLLGHPPCPPRVYKKIRDSWDTFCKRFPRRHMVERFPLLALDCWRSSGTTQPFPRLIQNISRTMNNRPVEQALSTLVPTHANEQAISAQAYGRAISSSGFRLLEKLRDCATSDIAYSSIDPKHFKNNEQSAGGTGIEHIGADSCQ